jgi:hypothetical protein
MGRNRSSQTSFKYKEPSRWCPQSVQRTRDAEPRHEPRPVLETWYMQVGAHDKESNMLDDRKESHAYPRVLPCLRYPDCHVASEGLVGEHIDSFDDASDAAAVEEFRGNGTFILESCPPTRNVIFFDHFLGVPMFLDSRYRMD